MNKKIIRKVIIWGLLIVICIPGILLGEMPAKIFGAVLGTLLISWDVMATKGKAKSKYKATVLQPAVVAQPKTPKQDKYAILETKPVWRLLKVLYIILSVVSIIGYIGAMSTEIAECRYESVVRGTRMIQAAIQRNIDNGTVCNVESTQIGAVVLGVIVLLGLYAGYLLFKYVVRYIMIGKSSILA